MPVQGEIALAAHALDGVDVHVGVETLVAGDGFVEKPLAFLLLAPQASADQADAIDDDEVAVGTRGQLVVELEGDVVGVRRVENFAKRNG